MNENCHLFSKWRRKNIYERYLKDCLYQGRGKIEKKTISNIYKKYEGVHFIILLYVEVKISKLTTPPSPSCGPRGLFDLGFSIGPQRLSTPWNSQRFTLQCCGFQSKEIPLWPISPNKAAPDKIFLLALLIPKWSKLFILCRAAAQQPKTGRVVKACWDLMTMALTLSRHSKWELGNRTNCSFLCGILYR